MGYCEYCGVSYQKKICAYCLADFTACDCDWLCPECADAENEDIEEYEELLESEKSPYGLWDASEGN